MIKSSMGRYSECPAVGRLNQHEIVLLSVSNELSLQEIGLIVYRIIYLHGCLILDQISVKDPCKRKHDRINVRSTTSM